MRTRTAPATRRLPALPTALLGVALLTGWAAPAVGQARIEGRVVDGATGAPIHAAAVTVVGSSFGAMADAEGRFLISNVPVGTHTLVATHLGYAEGRRVVAITEGVNQVGEIQLRSEALALDYVVVTGGIGWQLRRWLFPLAALIGGIFMISAAERRFGAERRVIVSAAAAGGVSVGALFAIVWLTLVSGNLGALVQFPIEGLLIGGWVGVWNSWIPRSRPRPG